MNNLTVKTNNQWRDLVYSCDVPASVLNNQFDWCDNPEHETFFKYRGYWYCLSDFMTTNTLDKESELSKWHGYSSDSFFSGVVVRFSDCGDCIQVGTYFS